MAVSVRPEILGSLTEGIATLTSSDAWRRHLHVARRFYNYSFSSVMLIHRQAPDATHVAGFVHLRRTASAFPERPAR